MCVVSPDESCGRARAGVSKVAWAFFAAFFAASLAACAAAAGDAGSASDAGSADAQNPFGGGFGGASDGGFGGGADGGGGDAGGDAGGAVADAGVGIDAGIGDGAAGGRGDSGPCTPVCVGLACGDDGCGGSCGTCGVGTTCVEGLCASDAPAGPRCGAAWGCVQACGDDRACALACASEVDPTERPRLRGAVRCLTEHCSVCAGDRLCEAHCVRDACADEIYGCFRGDDTCLGIGACVEACPDQVGCADACARAGSPEAQRAWWDLILCVTDACGPGVPAACRTLVTGPAGACGDAFTGCL